MIFCFDFLTFGKFKTKYRATFHNIVDFSVQSVQSKEKWQINLVTL